MRRTGTLAPRTALLLVGWLTLAGIGCGGPSPTGAGSVLEGVWKLRALEQNGSSLAVSDPERYTLDFGADGRLAVRADCNRCSSAYTRAGEILTLGPLACTRAACPPDSLEPEFLSLLDGGGTLELRDAALTIRSAGGVLRLSR